MGRGSAGWLGSRLRSLAALFKGQPFSMAYFHSREAGMIMSAQVEVNKNLKIETNEEFSEYPVFRHGRRGQPFGMVL